ncbi:MAG TPA: type II secretion system F family protein [Syntrophales bacterium]|jgi:type IV pilus assembly protein PilC|nr:type II secretion system F family protein [Syntrophales bacterium]
MPAYVWEGTTRAGAVKKGELEAVDPAAVRTLLRRQGFKSITVKAKPKDLLEYLPFLKQKVKEKEVVVFCRIFATMINAGLPLMQCLDLLAQQEANKTFQTIIRAIKEDIEGGMTLTDALKKYPEIFDQLFVNLVAAGESGGILDVILQRLSSYMEKSMKLKAKVKGAMTYPASVLVIAVGVVALLLIKVIPVFQKMFEGMGGELPGPTQFLVNASQFTQNYWWVGVAIIVAIGYAFKRFYATEKGTLTIDAMLLKAPVFGPLIKKVAVAKFTRTLSTMMSSGVPILEGLSIVSKTAGNKIIENALVKVRHSISEGKTIAEPLEEANIFPPMVVQMIAVGEATGALDTMLAKIADFYDDEVDAAVEALTALLEPFMMVFLGGVCGGMIIAMYLPIFKMASVVGG